jgi:Vam6/Vps39-like protein vacuolar protein sorting-associated protein 39
MVRSPDNFLRYLANLKPDPHFYAAQAIVLSNMGQHKQALEIYVFKLKDYSKAEECVHSSLCGD